MMIDRMSAYELMEFYGADIIASSGMRMEKEFLQHGRISVYEHSIAVTLMCICIARRVFSDVNYPALIRGALLHDYFLYDWHDPDPSHKWHGLTHARDAWKNACRDFELGEIERDMITKHMFPLNIKPPKYKESIILCMADKICATKETVIGRFPEKGSYTN